MTCFHIPYLILSHVPFPLILSFIFFWSFRSEGELGHLGLLGLETFGPWEDSTEDYLFWGDVDIPYKRVDPSLGSLLHLSYQPLLLLDIPHTRQPLLPIPTRLDPLLQSSRPRGHHVIPQSDGGIQDVLLQDRQVELLRRISLKPTPQNTHGHLVEQKLGQHQHDNAITYLGVRELLRDDRSREEEELVLIPTHL